MSDQVDKGEELSDRFSTRSRPKREQDLDDTEDTGGQGATDGVGDTGHTPDVDDTGHTGDTEPTDDQDDMGHSGDQGGGGTTRERTQYVMYLPDDLQDDLNSLYEQYNGQSLINGDGGIEKHKDFLEGIVRAGLDHPDLDKYVGVDRESS